jgi:leucyl aminopeptidase
LAHAASFDASRGATAPEAGMGDVKVEVTAGAAGGVAAGLLAVPLFVEDLADGASGVAAELDRGLSGHLARAAGEERFAAKPGEALLLNTLGGLAAARVLLLGLGPRAGAERIAAAGFEALRMAAGRAARDARKAGAARLAIALPRELDAAGAARAAVEGALLGAYRFDRYKSDRDGKAELGELVLAVPDDAAAPEVSAAAELGRAMAEAVAWARDLVNEPPLECTPSRLARAAQELARAAGLRCEVRGPRDIARLRMGLFEAVTRGSAEEPRLVTVSYAPRGAAQARPLVLVGKAITFDSGGLSLKPTESMVTMNGDMAGSAAVLAAMKVVARLAPPFPVHAVLGACENMPGGRAYKPSDVLRAYDGTTVEVTNTDAEGRLVLGDVLAWAVETLAPAAVLDVATLTGACVVALGHTTAGAWGPDGPAIDAVLAAARAAGEDVWRMPLTEAVKDNLKSDVADLKNTGERWGSAIAAAHFLHRFVGETPWVHLDIAGPANAGKERGYVVKGGTGFAVRTLFEVVRSWKPDGAAAPRRTPRRKGALPGRVSRAAPERRASRSQRR